MIVEQSNLYATEAMDEEKAENWNPITTRNLEAYFGFTILMGITHFLLWKIIGNEILGVDGQTFARRSYCGEPLGATVAPRGSPLYDLEYLETRFS